jgi:hypothetical protein
MIEIVVQETPNTTTTLTENDNVDVKTLAAGSSHYLASDTRKRLILSVTFPASSNSNKIRILPTAPETKVDTQGFVFPIEEITDPQGNPEGRVLKCPKQSNGVDYTQTRLVVTPPDAQSFGNESDELDRLEREYRNRPYIRLKVTVKHS